MWKTFDCEKVVDFILYGMTLSDRIKRALPKDSINKPDLLAVFAQGHLLKEIVQELSKPFHGKVDCVISPEAVGWVVGAAVATELGVPFIGARKLGNLPYAREAFYHCEKVVLAAYTDYSGREKVIEITRDSMPKSWVLTPEGRKVPSAARVLIVDDWTDTGAGINACRVLIEKLNGTVIGAVTIKDLLN